jgi:hypothetical protein
MRWLNPQNYPLFGGVYLALFWLNTCFESLSAKHFAGIHAPIRINRGLERLHQLVLDR